MTRAGAREPGSSALQALLPAHANARSTQHGASTHPTRRWITLGSATCPSGTLLLTNREVALECHVALCRILAGPPQLAVQLPLQPVGELYAAVPLVAGGRQPVQHLLGLGGRVGEW